MTAPDELRHPLLESKRAELFALCEQHGVAQLELLGSAVHQVIDEESS